MDFWRPLKVSLERGKGGIQDIRTYTIKLSFTTLTVSMMRLGKDYHLALWGGDEPHIGCTVLAVPRKSLRGNGQAACTASVLNVTGHKDEEICRYLAEETAKRSGAVAVCTGGFHMDNITEEQINEVLKAVRRAVKEINL